MGSSIKDVRKISAKIDPLPPCPLLSALDQPFPLPCGRPHLAIGAEDTEHDHSVIHVYGYLIQVCNYARSILPVVPPSAQAGIVSM